MGINLIHAIINVMALEIYHYYLLYRKRTIIISQVFKIYHYLPIQLIYLNFCSVSVVRAGHRLCMSGGIQRHTSLMCASLAGTPTPRLPLLTGSPRIYDMLACRPAPGWRAPGRPCSVQDGASRERSSCIHGRNASCSGTARLPKHL